MLCIDAYKPSLGLALKHIWARRSKLNKENRFAVTLNGRQVAKVDAEQSMQCIHVPDIAIIALKFRIMGFLKDVPNTEKYGLPELSLEGRTDIDIAWQCDNRELVSALVESLVELAKKKRDFEYKLNFSKQFVLKKNCKYFEVPLAIHFEKPDKCPTHSLHAVVVHSGLPGSGHYWTYIRFIDKQRMKQWYMFNDVSVNTVTESDVLELIAGGRTTSKGDIIKDQPVAYILSYLRTKCISKLTQ